MMFGFLGPMMLGFGSLVTSMFGGLFNTFFWPMWTMMSGWFGLIR